jgi:hypothetical protein
MKPRLALPVLSSLLLLGCGGDPPTEPVPHLPTVYLSTDRASAHQGLDALTITWTTANAHSCEASGAWQGTRPVSGSDTILPEVSGAHDFHLACSNTDGTTQASRSVAVSVLEHSSCAPQRFEEMGEPNGPVQMRQYVVTNNVGSELWDEIPGFSSCISSRMTDPDGLSFTMDWVVPVSHEEHVTVKGYPNASVGRVEPITRGSLRSTTAMLPMRVSDVPASLTIRFDAEYERSGQFITLGDLFIYAEADGDWSQMKEVMLVFDAINIPIYHPADSVVLDLGGVRWVRGDTGGERRPHPHFPNDSTTFMGGIQYHMAPYGPEATFHLKPILDDMLAIGFLTPDDWIIFLQWGVELVTGSSTLTMQRYEVTW